MKPILLRSGNLVEPTGLRKTDVLVNISGEIAKIAPSITDHDAETVDASGMLLFPLLIDCHVHFREPGLEHKATMATEGAAALAGGVGTVCEMPNTMPPTVTVAALADKVRRAANVDGCDLRFFFGVTEVIHLAALRDLWTGSSMEMKKLKHHCCGVKLYLDHSTGNQKIEGSIIEDVFKTCAELKIPIVAHCEDPEMNAKLKAANTSTDIAAHSAMRPSESEEKSVREAIEMVRKTGAHLHVAHLSTKKGLDLVRVAKKEKLPVTCEVAPHHLLLTTDDYKTLGTLGKMNPPLRSRGDCDALWAGIADGTIDCVSTDHAPHTLDEKRAGNPLDAPSGVPGVETMLPLLLDAMKKGKLMHQDIFRLCFTNPNQIFSLGVSAIEIGKSARIAIVDPKAEWTIKGSELHSKCGWTPYEGWKVTGKVTKIIAH